MSERVLIFIDFWNFQLQWNARASGANINWKKVSSVLLANAATLADLKTPRLIGTRVYASADSTNPKEAGLKRWLDTFLDRQPGFTVLTKDRQVKTKPVRCRACKHEVSICPSCSTPYVRSVEKGIDTAIATDLLTMSWDDVYDVAILVSADSDFVPAVESLQNKGTRVVNATWRGHGYHLAKKAWASFYIDDMVGTLTR